MVTVALFCHEDPIHAQGDISKDGVGKIVDAVGVSGIVSIRIGQIGFQSLIPSRWTVQADLDFDAEGIGVVIIVGARNGERDGLDACQGGLKLHLPRGFVPIIHIGHVKQLERHAAVCPWGSTSSPFYTLSPPLPPGFGLVGPQHLPEIPPFHPSLEPTSLSGLVLVGREDLYGIPPAHASGRAKKGASSHLACLSNHVEGVRQAGGGVHQGIARHRRLAKDGAPDLVRRDVSSTGPLPSNTILRFEKTTHAYHFQRPKMSRTRCVALL